jgi:hypothetical protein
MRQAGIDANVSVWTWMGLMVAGLALATAGCASREAKQACSPNLSGCQKPLVVLAPAVTAEMESTPSTTFVDQSGAQASLKSRSWEPMAGYYEAPAVQHGPLYFQDELENVGTVRSDCPIGISGKDFVAVPYSDGRWMLNSIALPVSMVVNPPWQPTCSDGEPGRTGIGLATDAAPTKRLVPVPFDLQCPDAQNAALAQLSGGPLPVTSPAPIPTSVPASQPVR